MQLKMETPEPGLRSLPVLDDASMMKLGLFDAGNDGRLLMDTNMTRHGLHQIRNPLNFNPNTGLFLIDDEDRRLRGWSPCHPDEIAIPTYFVSYETLVFVGFKKIKAMELWESYKMENDAADKSVPIKNKAVLHQNTFRILRHAQRYLKANAKHATTFRQLQDVGFDNSTVYAGFQPSMRYTNGSPSLDTVDVLQPSGRGTKLLAWALRITFRRFIFLSQLNAMLEGAELEEEEEEEGCISRIRPALFHWSQLITLFETNENRGNFLPEDDDSFDSEMTETDAENSDVVELYEEKKEGATSKVKMEEGVFPDKDTLEAVTPRPFSYYSDEDKKLRDAAHRYFEEGLETNTQALATTLKTEKLDKDKKMIDAAHHCFDEEPETDTKAEKLDEYEKKIVAAHRYFDEDLEMDVKAPVAIVREAKKAKITDAEMMPPPSLPAC